MRNFYYDPSHGAPPVGKTAQFASLGLRITVADVDGRLSGVLGLEGLKLSESASTALIYPGKLSV